MRGNGQGSTLGRRRNHLGVGAKAAGHRDVGLAQAIPVLEKIAKTVLSPRYKNYVLEVEGHTDDDPISTPVFPSNWELSAGRASRVVRFMTDAGMEADRLKASLVVEAS